MPPIDVNLKNSEKRTRKEYGELHHWIDDDKAKYLVSNCINFL